MQIHKGAEFRLWQRALLSKHDVRRESVPQRISRRRDDLVKREEIGFDRRASISSCSPKQSSTATVLKTDMRVVSLHWSAGCRGTGLEPPSFQKDRSQARHAGKCPCHRPIQETTHMTADSKRRNGQAMFWRKGLLVQLPRHLLRLLLHSSPADRGKEDSFVSLSFQSS